MDNNRNKINNGIQFRSNMRKIINQGVKKPMKGKDNR